MDLIKWARDGGTGSLFGMFTTLKAEAKNRASSHVGAELANWWLARHETNAIRMADIEMKQIVRVLRSRNRDGISLEIGCPALRGRGLSTRQTFD